MIADRVSADSGGQQKLADEIGDRAGRLPRAGSGVTLAGGAG